MISKLLFGLLILFTLVTTAMSVLKVSSEIKENASVLPTVIPQNNGGDMEEDDDD